MLREPRRTDYLLMLLTIFVSGNPVFIFPGRTEAFLILTFLLLTAVFFYRKESLDRSAVAFSALFLPILLYQAYAFNFFSPETIIGFFIRASIGYLAFKIIRKPMQVYRDVMYFTSLISLFFFAASEFVGFFGISLKALMAPLSYITFLSPDVHIVFYNFDGKGELHRNSSFFWEPGAYSGYLIIAIIFNAALHTVTPTKNHYRILAVLVTSLLSTKSTMGYLVAPLAILLNLSFASNRKTLLLQLLGLFLLVPILLLFVVPNISKLSFIGQKISDQIYEAQNEKNNWQVNRFGNMIFDWEYISQRPFLGWGLNDRTRYALNGGEVISGQGNGLTGIIVKLGFVGFFFYLCFIYRSFLAIFKGKLSHVFIAISCVILTLNGETFLNFPIYWGLAFLSSLGTARREHIKDLRYCPSS